MMRSKMIVGMILLFCLIKITESYALEEAVKTKILHQEWQLALNQQLKQNHPKTRSLMPASVNQDLLNQKISINVKQVPLHQLIHFIAKGMDLNAIVSVPSRDQKVDCDVHQMTISMVLESILFPLNLGYKFQDGAIMVLDRQTQVFKVLLPPVNQAFEDTTSNESYQTSGSDQQGFNQSQQNSQDIKVGATINAKVSQQAISFWDDLEKNIKSLISEKGNFTINKVAGTVIVTDHPVNLNQIAKFFDDLNGRITQQIEVDVKVLEVSLANEENLGVDWQLLMKNLGDLNALAVGTNFASQNFSSGNVFTFTAQGPSEGAGITEKGIKTVIQALAKQGKVEVVSQPRITMLNNQLAVIQVGTTQSYLNSTRIETTQTGTVSSISTAQVQEGVTMRLLGNVVGQDVYLSVTPVVTSIDNIRSVKSGNTTVEAPQTTTKSINTLVKLKQGETVAIGGLITSQQGYSKEGVPVLSKMPLLGSLFSYQSKKNNKVELVILITPRKI